jgi:hypothetical protein
MLCATAAVPVAEAYNRKPGPGAAGETPGHNLTLKFNRDFEVDLDSNH